MSNFFKILREHGNDYHERNLSRFNDREKSHFESLVAWMKPLCSKHKLTNMLEIGSGPCFVLNYLSKELSLKGYGIDPSDKANRYASELYPDLKLFNGVSYDLSWFEENSFDYIHLGFFLYLLDDKYYSKTVSEVNRVLKDGGYLSILDFDTPHKITKEYTHHKDLKKINKLDQSYPFRKTSLFTLINKISFSEDGLYFNQDIDQRRSVQLLFKEKETGSNEVI